MLFYIGLSTLSILVLKTKSLIKYVMTANTALLVMGIFNLIIN
jgi:hypothetical protein